MPELGRILIADDDEVFLDSIAELLERESYACDRAPDSQTATEMLRGAQYDVLISDFRMPGNERLEFVRQVGATAEGLPIILVTAHPSLSSALDSFHLPVVAYLVKPFQFADLLARVEASIENSKLLRSLNAARRRLKDWHNDLDRVERAMPASIRHGASAPVAAFAEIAFHNMFGALLDLRQLTQALTVEDPEREACHLFNCPKLGALSEAVDETLATLRRTRGAFKSKELGKLRSKLRELVGR